MEGPQDFWGQGSLPHPHASLSPPHTSMGGFTTADGLFGGPQRKRGLAVRGPKGFLPIAALLLLVLVSEEHRHLLLLCASHPIESGGSSSNSNRVLGHLRLTVRGSASCSPRDHRGCSDVRRGLSSVTRGSPLWLSPPGVGADVPLGDFRVPAAAAAPRGFPSRCEAAQNGVFEESLEDSGKPSEGSQCLHGVSVSVSPLLNTREAWNKLPRLLRGKVPYEATAVARLRAAGASVYAALPQGSASYKKGFSSSNHTKCHPSQTPTLHLVVSAVPPFQIAPPPCASDLGPARNSSSRSSKLRIAARSEEAHGKQAVPQRHLVAFAPTRGSVSCFGCLSATAGLLEEMGSTAATAAGAAIAEGPSPLLRASSGPPVFWLCGEDVSLLRRGLRAISGVDSRDLATVLFQQQQRQQRQSQQQQQQQQAQELDIRVALLRMRDTGVSDRDTVPSSVSSQQQQLLQLLQRRLEQRQHQQLWNAAGPHVCYLAAETLQRAIIGGALLQCCEAAGQLLRVGQEAARSSPPSSDRGTHQQEQQQQWKESFWRRLFKERTDGLPLTVKRRMLLGGTVLRDPTQAVLLRGAHIAQETFRLRLGDLLRDADALLHLAEAHEGSSMRALHSLSCASLDTGSEAGSPRSLSGRVPKPHHSLLGAPSETVPLPLQETPLSVGSQAGAEGLHEQLLGAATATGHPCFVSAEGWLLLGTPGRDSLLLDIAATLSK